MCVVAFVSQVPLLRERESKYFASVVYLWRRIVLCELYVQGLLHRTCYLLVTEWGQMLAYFSSETPLEKSHLSVQSHLSVRLHPPCIKTNRTHTVIMLF